MVYGQKLFYQPVKIDIRTYDNIIATKIVTCQGDDYTTVCLLDYLYFKENYKLIAIDLSKPQTINADPKSIHQIKFIRKLEQGGNTTMFFIIKDFKETILDFLQGTVKTCVVNDFYKLIWC